MKEDIVILSLKCVKNGRIVQPLSHNLYALIRIFMIMSRTEKQIELPNLSTLETGRTEGSNWVQNKHVFTSNWTDTIKFLSFWY